MLADANPKTEGHAKPRLSSAERRAAIVKAAIDLFAKHGFHGTTTRELAAAVGVTEPVLYQHFATKRELHSAIVDQMIARVPLQDIEVLKGLAQSSDDRAFFTELGRQILRWHAEDTRYTRLLLFSALEGHELAELWEERAKSDLLTLIESYIQRRSAEGAYNVARPALAARAFAGMIGHAGMMGAIFKCHLSSEPVDTLLDQYVTMFLHGILNPSRKDS